MNIDKDSFDYPPELRQEIPYRYKLNDTDLKYELQRESFPVNNSYVSGLSPMTPRYIPSKLPLTY